MSCSNETSKMPPPSPSVTDREHPASAAPPQSERRPVSLAAGRRAAGRFGAARGAMARLVLAGILLLAGSLAPPALAQSGSLPEPVDPLKRPERSPGLFSLSFSLDYNPGGGQVFDIDDDGRPYTERLARHAFSPSLGLRYDASERMELGFTLTLPYAVVQRLRTYAPDDQRYIEEGRLSSSAAASLAYRAAPESPYDPTLSVTLARPWSVDLSAAASLLRDPVVVSAAAGYTHSFMPPFENQVRFSAGAGFVANDRFSFSLRATLKQALVFAAPAELGANFSTSYSLNPEGTAQVTLGANAWFGPAATSYGVSLGFSASRLDLGAWLLAGQEK